MSATKRRRRGKTNNNLYTVIICALGLILLILCIILISRSCSSQSASPSSSLNSALEPTISAQTDTLSPSGTQGAFETQTASASATQFSTSSAVSTQSAAGGTVPTASEAAPTPTPQPINISSNQVLALHITVDTGYSQPENEIFSDDYILSRDYEMNMDAGNIKVVVFITDYRGNSTVRFFENMSAACIFSSFTFSDDTISLPAEDREMSIVYDSAGTANITWAGQSVSALIDGEADGPYQLNYSSVGKTARLEIENLGMMDKDIIFP